MSLNSKRARSSAKPGVCVARRQSPCITPPGLGGGRSWRTGEQPRHPFEEVVRRTDTRRARAVRAEQGDAIPSDLAKRHHASDAPLNDFLPHVVIDPIISRAPS